MRKLIESLSKLVEAERPKKWIAKAISKPGALKKSLGVGKEEKIPRKKLVAAASKPGKIGKRARLAITLRKLGK